ncbi:MAG: hypothetical protein IPM29_01305 [Planctomycetes bacterium]|nr:hypothetical protein [Planctomycetota bacterium]
MPGELVEFRIVAEAGDPGLDLAAERRRLETWLAEHPEARQDPAAIVAFHATPAVAGGPGTVALRWAPHVVGVAAESPGRWDRSYAMQGLYGAVAAFAADDWNDGGVPAGRSRLLEYVPLSQTRGAFDGSQLDPESLRVTTDDMGRPALEYQMRVEHRQQFAEWSEANVGRCAAIVVRGRVVSAPRFMSRIRGRALISGNLTSTELEELARSVRENTERR